MAARDEMRRIAAESIARGDATGWFDTFYQQAGGTLVKITVVYPSKEARDGALASGMEHGMSAGYDRLDAMLAEAAAQPA